MTHTNSIEKSAGATNAASTKTKRRILILGDLVYTHLDVLASVAVLHRVECITMDDIARDGSTDLWAKAREHVDHGDTLFIHACQSYLRAFPVPIAGLIMYALGRGGKVVLMFDTDVTIEQHARFESITDSLGYRAYQFILPDAVPVMLRYFLQHTDALGPLPPPPGAVRRPHSPRGAAD